MASELPEALQSNFTSVLFGNSYSASLAFLVVSLCLAVPLLVFLSKHPPIMAQSTQSAQPSSKITETQLPIVASISHETAAPADPYIAHLPALEKQFLEFADTEAQPVSTGPDAKWVSVIEQKDGDYSISVQKSPSSDFFFRIVVDFESSAEETFDMIADINKRADWDEVTESSGIVQPISNKTSVNVYCY